MHIVFYSTSSNYFTNTLQTKNFPLHAEEFSQLAEKFPEHKFTVATQKPGMFLLDLDENGEVIKSTEVNYKLLENDDEEKIASELAELNPDVCIAASFYVTPFDWLTVKDGIVANHLKEKNIKVYYHPVSSSLTCFDKWQTHNFLQYNNFNVANAVYVHHALFACAGNRKEIKSNVYRESVFNQIKKMHYPLIIKDTVGLSSYGMEVAQTFEEAKMFLLSKRNTSDRIVEELIEGQQFGLEIYGCKNNYTVMPPFIFSVNKYGITSPKQSVKIGPVVSEDFKIEELKKEMTRLAELLRLEGIAQVDLVFANDKWYIIEINPRLSGMTQTYASSLNCTIPELLLNSTVFADSDFNTSDDCILCYSEMKKILNIKFSLLEDEMLKKVSEDKNVRFIQQIKNLAAKQEREKGYCEVHLGFTDTFEELKNILTETQQKFSDVTEAAFVEKALELLKNIQ